MSMTSHDVRRLLGDIDGHKRAEIIASGAMLAELEQVAFHLTRRTDVRGDLQRPVSGRALRIYELVRRAEDDDEEP